MFKMFPKYGTPIVIWSNIGARHVSEETSEFWTQYCHLIEDDFRDPSFASKTRTPCKYSRSSFIYTLKGVKFQRILVRKAKQLIRQSAPPPLNNARL